MINNVQKEINDIISDILDIESVDINDKLVELGFNSIKVIKLEWKLSEKFGIDLSLENKYLDMAVGDVINLFQSDMAATYVSIPEAEDKEWYNTSSAQKRMYALYRINFSGVNYNVPSIQVVEGTLDLDKVEKCFKKLIERHEILRTSYHMQGENVVQKVHTAFEFKLENITMENNIESSINKFIRPFNLACAPVMRAGVMKADKGKHIIIMDVHHIGTDGTSDEIFWRDFWRLYRGKELPEQKIQYKDYSKWQDSRKISDSIGEQKEYWKSIFSDEIPVLGLVTDYYRPAVQSFEGDTVNFNISEELTKKLKILAEHNGVTMYMLLLSAFFVLLGKHSRQEDIVIGTPVAGRNHADLENVAGMFVNTIALRNRPKAEETFEDFLREVRETTLSAFDNQEYQFEELAEALNIRRDMSRNPLFDVMFVYQNMESSNEDIPELKISSYYQKSKTSKFDLTLEAWENEERLEFGLEYCRKLFKKETIVTIADHYKRILEEVAEDSEKKLSQIDMMTEAEREKVLNGFNDTESEYEKDLTLVEIFEAQAMQNPAQRAVIFGEKELTYEELNRKANQLARHLTDRGVQAGDFVGVLCEKSIEMIIGILGILKAGGAYVPIDTTYPEERIRYMLEDCCPKVILTKETVLPEGTDCCQIDLSDQEVFTGGAENPGICRNSQCAAYVIYTSGSTGLPKGVLIEHRNAVRLVRNTNYLEFEQCRMLQTGSISFDASAFEIWGALLNNGTLCIARKEEILNPEKFRSVVRKNGIDRMLLTTVLFNQLIIHDASIFDTIPCVVVGGEKISERHVERLLKINKTIRVLNAYGPTENGTVTTTYEVKEFKSREVIPIGRPIANTKAYILNDSRLCGIGIPGELCVAGDGVARGYLNQPELTELKFVHNPFGEGKMYRTGDLARWLPDGNIEYLGRIDNQVKVRGYRIEPEEIENRLRRHESIREAVVLKNERETGEAYLSGYVVLSKDMTAEELKNYLGQALPEYMIPERFVQIDEIPVTPNGKLDRRKLLSMNGEIESGSKFAEPENEAEERMLAIWQEILRSNKISTNDNFFTLGGQSLKAIALISLVSREFGKELSIEQIFKNPSIRVLVKELEGMELTTYEKIGKAGKKEWYPASSEQKRMYALSKFGKGSINYNVPVIYKLNGKLDTARAEDCVRKLIVRHEILRTAYDIREDEVVQIVRDAFEFHLEYHKVSYKEDGLSEGKISRMIEDFIRTFDLSGVPAVHGGIIETAEEEYILMLDMPHIATDGISEGIFRSEFWKLYNGETLPEQELQYKDYSEWQASRNKSGMLEEQKEYWKNIFSDEIPVLGLVTDYHRSAVQSYGGDTVDTGLSEEQTEKLKKLAADNGVTMYMLLLSAFNVLLGRYAGQEDIVIGTPVAGRNHADLENVLGMFVNTLPMRNRPKAGETFEEFLREVKETTLAAFSNQEYQFEELVEALNIRGDMSRNPLFDVMFAYQDIDSSRKGAEGITITGYTAEKKTTKFDISFTAWEEEDKLHFEFTYCTRLYKRQSIKFMGRHFARILEEVAEDSKKKLSQIDIMTEDEREKVLYHFNDTGNEYANGKTIIDLFEEQVEKTPGNCAVIFGTEEISYRELNNRVNFLAKELRQLGVKPDDFVPVVAERSIEMIAGIYGIIKAGGAYVPIDPNYPEERIGYIVSDCKAKVILLGNGKFVGRVPQQLPALVLSDERYKKGESGNLEHVNTPQDLVYVVYTSGTTGRPKGVMNKHEGLFNRIQCWNSRYPIGEGDVILQKTTYTFDLSVWEIICWSLTGARLAILEPGAEKVPSKIVSAIGRYKVTTIHFVPSMLDMFLSCLFTKRGEAENIRSLKYVFSGGEALRAESLRHFNELVRSRNQAARLINCYGPTEASIDVTYFECGYDYDKIPIGKPITNTKLYIMNGESLCGIGVPGELCITGIGVAKGYLNLEQLTQDKFIDNPFGEGKMYRTGDLARWLPDGNIEYLGRIDSQVKIRGFRIEPGEIENRLCAHKDIKGAAVLVNKDENDNGYLCGYIAAGRAVTIEELKVHLAKTLPEYMIPERFVQIGEIPVTPNGKLDRKKLLSMNGEIESGSKFAEPENEAEEKMLAIWQEILRRNKISTNDNFFTLGGQSLKAIALMSLVSREFGKELSIEQIFKNPSIRALVKELEGMELTTYEKIGKAGKKEWYPASSEQKRMYALSKFGKGSINYNVPVINKVDGKLDIERVEDCIRKLIERHEILRTAYDIRKDEVVQIVRDTFEFCLEYRKVTGKEAGLPDEVSRMIEEFIRPFDLSVVPVVHGGIIEVREEEYILMLDMPHIATDGISEGIFRSEFWKLYNGETLPEQELQYKDYSEWQASRKISDSIGEQKEYWKNIFSDEIPVLGLVADYHRPAVQSYGGDTVDTGLSEEQTEKLKKLAADNGVTMYMLLLSAFNVLLGRYAGQEDIVIGTPVAGRNHADLENVLGMFVNTLPMRNRPKAGETFEEFLREVKETTLAAFDNQEYQFEELVEALNVERDMSRNPLFDVMFAYQDIDSSRKGAEGITITGYTAGKKSSKFDISFTAWEEEGKLHFEFTYCTRLYKRQSIEFMGRHFARILEEVAEDSRKKLSQIDMMTKAEREKVQYHFNDTDSEYEKDLTLVEIFEEQAMRNPAQRAIVSGEEELTYEELNRKANQLAHCLAEKGVQTGNFVAVLCEKSIEMVIGILGILKAGGAYVPIDTTYPGERIRYMLEDCCPKAVVTQAAELPEGTGFCRIDLSDGEVFTGEAGNPGICRNSQGAAYVIYTSGSTGLPKGVLIEHRNAVRLVRNANYLELEQCRMLQTSSISFDISALEIWGALLNNGTLCIARKEEILNPEKFRNIVKKNGIDRMVLATALFNHLVACDASVFDTVPCVVTGGEKISESHVERLIRRNKTIRVLNGYGPTENGTVTTTYEVKEVRDREVIPIGKPIANTKAYILDDGGLCGIGVPGELCVTGDGVAKGYLNQPELTRLKFIDNPFGEGKMYKTGDLARWLPDGNIEYLGRLDNQVKVRGYRIEPEEIENRLRRHESIREAVVLKNEKETGEVYLCGYVVLSRDMTAGELKNYLGQTLPEYMIPERFVQIEEIPVMTNGKLDRKKLLSMNGEIESGSKFAEPENEAEEKMLAIWQEILRRNKISTNDNFFTLGGQSLKAIALMSLVSREFGKELSIEQVFKNPSIRALVKELEGMELTTYEKIGKAGRKEWYPASSEQKRMYVLSKSGKGSINYNVPVINKVDGKLDIERVEDCIRKLIERHEILRTAYDIRKDEVVQIVRDTFEFRLEYRKVTGKEARLPDEVSRMIEEFIRPFDLSVVPVVHGGIIETAEEEYILMLDMPHIATDGISEGIFRSEFWKLYNGETLPEQELQYKDYSEWQASRNKSGMLEEQKEYWKNIFSDEIPVLGLVTDYHRPAVQSYRGDTVDTGLSEEQTEKLKKVAADNGVTMYMLLLSAFNVLMGRYAGQEDIVIGTPVAGRNHADLENVLGMFVNTLPMRNRPKAGETFEEFLREVKETTLAAFDNQEYQFEELVEALNIERDMSRNPLFDVMFAYQNLDSSRKGAEGITITGYPAGKETSKFDISFTAWEEEGKLHFEFTYCTRLYKRQSIEFMSRHFARILEEVAEDSKKKLSKIDMVTEDEREKVLYHFNDTGNEYANGKTIIDLFEEQVEETPDNCAVIFGTEEISYRELNNRVNFLAKELRQMGVKPDDFVPVAAERSIEMIVGIYGIIKAGGAYVPIDPDYPDERIGYIVSDCKAKVVLLGNGKLMGKVPQQLPVIVLSDERYKKGEPENLEHVNTPQDLVYVVYTSGTTGKPKGVMNKHEGLLNRIQWVNNRYQIGEGDVILQKTTYTFDISVWEIICWSLTGARLAILEPRAEKIPSGIISAIDRYKVTIIHFVPSMLDMFLSCLFTKRGEIDSIRSLKYVFSSGEALRAESLRHFNELVRSRNQAARLINCYGPTEASIDVSYFECEYDYDKILIGKPITNTRLYIMNGGSLCGIGVPGELCITGIGVAKGYLNLEQLTQDKFLDNPFGEGKMYRTGDLARWLPDGNIEYLGRIDSQVKIRGFRIEPEEIENRLREHKDIRGAAVLANKDENDNGYLCGYIAAERAVTIEELRSYLAKTLPEYMIPERFVQIEEIPVTSNGKLDRKKLLSMNGEMSSTNIFLTPENKCEEELLEIWIDILKRSKISVTDNFYMIGGNSLKAIILAAKASQVFDAEMSVENVMKYPTIREMAQHISAQARHMGGAYYGDNAVLLKENKNAAKTLFVIHDVSGNVGEYIELCSSLNINYNIYGINSGIRTVYPQNISIEDIAKEYIGIIRRIQPSGSFDLAGWSAGGVIAFEIAKQAGGTVDNIIMFDTYINEKVNLSNNRFTASSEVSYIKKIFGDCFPDGYEIKTGNDMKELWDFVVHDDRIRIENAAFNGLYKKILGTAVKENKEEFIKKLNVARTIENACKQYIAAGKIVSKIVYFKAKKSRYNQELIVQKHMCNELTLYEVNGDHFSIMKQAGAEFTANKINELFTV